MVTILFVASCALTILFFRKKRDLESQGREKEIAYFFWSNSLDFFAAFTLVLLFYGGLLAYISISSESVSLESLIWLEEFLTKLQTFFKARIKLSAETVFILVALVYLLSLLRIPFQRTYSHLSKTNRWVRRVYVGLALLSSFTLFGTQPGAPTGDLQFRIKTIRDGYADVVQQTRDAIAEEAASKLYDKVHNSFPSDYQQALKLPEEIGKQTPPLQNYYNSARTQHGIKLDKVESTLGSLSSRREAASKLKTELQVPEETPSKSRLVTEPTPPRVSYKQVKEAKSAVEKYRQSIQSKYITFLNTVEGKKLTLRLQKVLTGNLKNALFSTWVETYPILGPIIDQFVVTTVDNELHARLERAIPKTAEAITQNPDKIEQVVTNEASGLVEKTVIKPSPATLENAQNAVKQAKNDVVSIENCRTQIDAELRRVENHKISGLIAQLRSANEAIRESAVRSLSGMGEKISQAQVNELISIMRRGNQTWSQFLYRESHCKWFEDISVRYYAADALTSMRSPHVNSEIVREAQTCKGNSKTKRRVTDPGWI